MTRILKIGALCAVVLGALQASAMPLGYRLSRQARAAIRQVETEPAPVPTQEVWTVTFDAQDGMLAETTRGVTNGCAVGELPTPTKSGYAFDGWYTAAEGGEAVTAETAIVDDVTFYAYWTKNLEPEPTPEPQSEVVHELCSIVDGAAPRLASEYNGYLVDAKGNVKGTIQVKVGKPNKKTKLAAVKATVVLGAKKLSLKSSGKVEVAEGGPTTILLAGGDACEVTLGEKGLSGRYGAYTIDGARNFFTSKDKAEQGAANAALEKWLGIINVAWPAEGATAAAPYQTMTITIAKKGKAKVKGTLADGKTKISANSVFLVGDEWCCVPVVAPKANLAFTLWLRASEGARPYQAVEGLQASEGARPYQVEGLRASEGARPYQVVGLGDGVVVGAAGSLGANAEFRVPKDAALWSQIPGTVLAEYLPDGVAVKQSGTKWMLPKAGKVAYLRGTTEVDETKLGENPSGLKLKYKAKEGSFKGSFKVYADNGGKLKATTVNVTGVMVSGKGYGAATVKGKGSVPITIE